MSDDNIVNMFDFKKKHESLDELTVEAVLTPELVRDYKECILLVAEHADALSREDYMNAYAMMLKFNHLLMLRITEKGE